MAQPSALERRSKLASVLVPSAYVGVGTAFFSATAAAAYATTRGLSASLWSISQGDIRRKLEGTKGDLFSSTVAGSVAGAAFGAVRGGRALVRPSALVWAAAGFSGQGLISTATAFGLGAESAGPREPLLSRLAQKSWWPLKQISDEEYEAELNDKIIGLEVEIAMINDKIAALKSSKDGQAGMNTT
ncbi:hypothetical protein LTR66_016483 [Elasticomyces elasticus]|nr:hypothetical protein LTR66_016483 [Elasticomyces elasticus]